MSFLIDLLMGSWQTILPIFLAIVGGGYGMLQKNKATVAEAKKAQYKMVAESEKHRAKKAEEVTETVIESAKEMQKEIDDAKAADDTDRTHFS